MYLKKRSAFLILPYMTYMVLRKMVMGESKVSMRQLVNEPMRQFENLKIINRES